MACAGHSSREGDMGNTSAAAIIVGIAFKNSQEMIELLLPECSSLPKEVEEMLLDDELPYRFDGPAEYSKSMCYYDNDAPGVWGIIVEGVDWGTKEIVVRDLVVEVEQAGHELILVLEEWGASKSLLDLVKCHLMSSYG